MADLDKEINLSSDGILVDRVPTVVAKPNPVGRPVKTKIIDHSEKDLGSLFLIFYHKC